MSVWWWIVTVFSKLFSKDLIHELSKSRWVMWTWSLERMGKRLVQSSPSKTNNLISFNNMLNIGWGVRGLTQIFVRERRVDHLVTWQLLPGTLVSRPSGLLTGGNWQKWKRVFLTCPCHKIHRDEAVGLKSCKNTWKITMFVKMWNLGQYRENLIFLSITA